MPFDKGKKRKLIDNCGHGRCYSCMFKSEECPICREQNYDEKKGKKNFKLMKILKEDFKSSSPRIFKQKFFLKILKSN